MNKRIKVLLLIGLPLIGILAGFLLMGRTVRIIVDGKTAEVRTHALTVRGALRTAGFQVEPGDNVNPAENTWLSRIEEIQLNRASLIRIWVDPGGEILTLDTSALTPVEVLKNAGIQPSPQDKVLVNGQPVALDQKLDRYAGLTLQYIPASQVHLLRDGTPIDFTSNESTIGLALWKQGIHINGGDKLSTAFDQPLGVNIELSLNSAQPIEITADGLVIPSISAADSVGEALMASGIFLQDLDYTLPGENDALPADGKIQVVRVTEKLLMEQSVVAYETEKIADDALEINQQQVIEEGRNGLKASRIRVRYENGIEVSRSNENDVILVAPVTRVVHYGTKIVNNTLSTPEGTITYYMAVTVTATSYSPCRSGVEGKCYTGTSLGLPVKKGVIGVHRAWYNMFKGTQIYVPGYGIGTIADIGYYPYNDYWVDLGYTDADYEPWYSVPVTIYFISPAPAGFTGVLP